MRLSQYLLLILVVLTLTAGYLADPAAAQLGPVTSSLGIGEATSVLGIGMSNLPRDASAGVCTIIVPSQFDPTWYNQENPKLISPWPFRIDIRFPFLELFLCGFRLPEWRLPFGFFSPWILAAGRTGLEMPRHELAALPMEAPDPIALEQSWVRTPREGEVNQMATDKFLPLCWIHETLPGGNQSLLEAHDFVDQNGEFNNPIHTFLVIPRLILWSLIASQNGLSFGLLDGPSPGIRGFNANGTSLDFPINTPSHSLGATSRFDSMVGDVVSDVAAVSNGDEGMGTPPSLEFNRQPIPSALFTAKGAIPPASMDQIPLPTDPIPGGVVFASSPEIALRKAFVALENKTVFVFDFEASATDVIDIQMFAFDQGRGEIGQLNNISVSPNGKWVGVSCVSNATGGEGPAYFVIDAEDVSMINPNGAGGSNYYELVDSISGALLNGDPIDRFGLQMTNDTAFVTAALPPGVKGEVNSTPTTAAVGYSPFILFSIPRIIIIHLTPPPPPPPTPTPSSSPTPSNTSTDTPTSTSTDTPTPTETPTPSDTSTPTDTATPSNSPTPSNTPSNSLTPSRTYTPSLTNTPTNTRIPPTPTYTPSHTYTPSNTYTPSYTPTPTYTWTRTPTPRPTPTPTPSRKILLYSIEKDYFAGGGVVAKEGDVLVSGGLSAIEGGRYEQLLALFLKDPDAEGKDLGLDGIDAISIEGGILTRVFFSVEKSFTVTHPLHPLLGSTVSDGDLLSKSGIVWKNAAIVAPFDLNDPNTNQSAGDVGLDATDLEGVSPAGYDAWTSSFFSSSGDGTPPSSVSSVARVYFSVEEINDDFVTGSSAASPPGTGVAVSADDLLLHDLPTGTGTVFRSGADGVPSPAPSILNDFFDPSINDDRSGLDGVDMPDYLPNSDESGETGPVSLFPNKILFSTSLDDIFNPITGIDFRHGDLLSHELVGGGTAGTNKVERVNSALTGLTNPTLDLGLDAIDCIAQSNVKTRLRILICKRVFLPGNLNTTQQDGLIRIPIYAQSGCEIGASVDIGFQYSTILFANPNIIPGPNFQLTTSPKAAKGFNQQFPPFRLERTAPGEAGEILAEIELELANFSISTGGMIEWTMFEVDDEEDVAGSVPPAEVGPFQTPSKPVIQSLAPIVSTSVQVNWFANQAGEGVTGYTATVKQDGLEVASTTVSGTETSAVVSGLEPGTDYTLELVATNANGDSEPCVAEFPTRFDRLGSQQATLLERLSMEWDPAGSEAEDNLDSTIPEPVDINLDGRINAEDVIEIIKDHLKRMN